MMVAIKVNILLGAESFYDVFRNSRFMALMNKHRFADNRFIFSLSTWC